MKTTANFVKNLDGLRGIAIGLVILHHLTHSFGFEIFRKYLPDLNGAHLFFILSGFLITRSLLKSKNDPNYYSNFFSRRAWKIFPLYYIYLVFLWLASPQTHELQASFWVFVGNWHMLFSSQPPGMIGIHLWSLGIQEQFYLLWPMVIKKLETKQLMFVMFAMYLVGTGTRIALHAMTANNWFAADLVSVSALDNLALGAFVASWMQYRQESLMKSHRYFRLSVLPLFALALVTFENEFGVMFDSLLLTNIFLCALSAPAEAFESKLLGIRPFVKFGNMSYSIYLWHMFALMMTTATIGTILSFAWPKAPNLVHCLLTGAVIFPVMWFVGSIFFERIEKPCTQLSKVDLRAKLAALIQSAQPASASAAQPVPVLANAQDTLIAAASITYNRLPKLQEVDTLIDSAITHTRLRKPEFA